MEDCDSPAKKSDETVAKILASYVAGNSEDVAKVVHETGPLATTCLVHVPGGTGSGTRKDEVESCMSVESVPVHLF